MQNKLKLSHIMLIIVISLTIVFLHMLINGEMLRMVKEVLFILKQEAPTSLLVIVKATTHQVVVLFI